MRLFLIMGCLALCVAIARADDLLIPSLTLDDYVDQAIHVGVQGKENEWALESAGYARTIVFRQTDSPSFAAGYVRSGSGSDTNGTYHTRAKAEQETLTMNEVTPLGTTINSVVANGDGSTNTTLQGFPTTSASNLTGKPSWVTNITQPFYLFVKNPVLRERKRADLSFANAKDNFAATALSIRSQARSLYYDVILEDESIKVEERKVASTKKLLDVTQALVHAGKSAPVETARAKIRLQTDQRLLENATVAREKAVLSAKNYIYLPLDEPVHFVTALQFRPFDVSLDRIIEYAILHQPQLQILRRQRELARLDYDAAREPTLPTVSANGNYTYNETQNPPVYARSWTWTTSANWLFFDSFVTRDAVRIARIQEWVADLNISDGERTTTINVHNAYLDLRNQQKQIEEFTEQKEQAGRDVEVIRLRFQNGLDRLIDVFDAEDQLESLENEYLGLVVNFNHTKDQLSQYVGADVETLK